MTARGIVVRGEGVGRKLGFPTANLSLSGPPPERGVYAVLGEGPALGRRAGVCNVGVRPTVGGTRLVVEAHFPGFSGDLYGTAVTLRFLGRLREERKFESLDALRRQIALDIEASSRYNSAVTDEFNADGNLLGRLVALALIIAFLWWLGRFLGRA